MSALWPWLAIAGAGALHGLSPGSGWLLATACGVHARDDAEARRALAPIAVGQLAAMVTLACAFSLGLSIDRALMRDVAVALLVAAASWLWLRRAKQPLRIGSSARRAGVALASFVAASAQGAGLMLVPALVPPCAGSASAAEVTMSGSFALAVAAVAVHTAAMLLTTGVVAIGLCRGAAVRRRRRDRPLGWRCETVVTPGTSSVALMLADHSCREREAADCRSATSRAKALSTLVGSLSWSPSASASARSVERAEPSPPSCGSCDGREPWLVARLAIRRFDSSITACRVSGVM